MVKMVTVDKYIKRLRMFGLEYNKNSADPCACHTAAKLW